jgi:hypothetical protein
VGVGPLQAHGRTGPQRSSHRLMPRRLLPAGSQRNGLVLDGVAGAWRCRDGRRQMHSVSHARGQMSERCAARQQLRVSAQHALGIMHAAAGIISTALSSGAASVGQRGTRPSLLRWR